MRGEFEIKTMCFLVGTAACFGLLGGAIAEQFITPMINNVKVTRVRTEQPPLPPLPQPTAEIESPQSLSAIAFQVSYVNTELD